MGTRVARGSVAATDDAPEVRPLAVDHEGETVRHGDEIDDPVVVATPLSYNGPNAASTRIDRVRPEGFDIALEEWDYLDGSHSDESVGCLSVASGVGHLDGGAMVAAGTVDVGTEEIWTKFGERFSEPPVVLTATQTRNVSRPVVSRVPGVARGGFDVLIQGEEAASIDAAETVGFVAIERGTGTFGDRQYEAGVERKVDEDWHTIEFDGEYETPVFLAAMQTANGPDAATLRYRNLDANSVEVFVQEERSADDETRHRAEEVGYVVLDGGIEGDTSPSDGVESTDYGVGGYGVDSYGVEDYGS